MTESETKNNEKDAKSVEKATTRLLNVAIISFVLFVFALFFVTMYATSQSSFDSGNVATEDNDTISDNAINDVELIVSDMMPLVNNSLDPFAPGDFSQGGGDKSVMVRNGIIIYSAGGSSSCPPAITDAVFITEDDGQERIVLQEVYYPQNTICTMDFGMFSQTIERSDGEPIPDEIPILIESSR